ncbi:MAG: ATP-binding protein [Halobacteriota archaeon]|nr:ATP-binding protein [Halobacteriota archaeon]
MLKTLQPILCYSIIEKIGESIHAEVFKVVKKEEHGRLLILKRINTDIISKELFSHIDRQIRYLNSLGIPKVLVPRLHKDAGKKILLKEHKESLASKFKAAELLKKYHAERNLSLLTEKHPMLSPIKKKKELMKAPVFERLDTLYLLNASRSINQELELDKLLKTIMKFVLERLGAQAGYLFMLEDENLILRAQGTKLRTLNIELKEEKLCDVEGIGHAILQYVKRTKEAVKLGNASEEGLFKNNKEVLELELRSVLCLPILKQQNLLGIIYLQNNLIKSAFTEQNVESTSFLASQAAISLENAILVENMKKKEEELTESEQRYRILFKNVPIGVSLTNSNGKILDINNIASMTLGGTVKELEGTDVKDYYWGEKDRDLALKKIKDNGFISRYESIFKRIDGSTFDGRLSVNLVQWCGEDHFLTIIEDITESKRVEGELKLHRDHLEDLVKKRTALLEVANRELESFSYSVAHDLRAPLRSMDGFSTALLEDYSDKLDDQGIHYLNRIKDSSHRMAILIDDLLELSRVTRREMACKNVDLTKIARSIIKDLRMNDPKRSVEVDIEEGLSDRGDPILIKQALGNLFDNSWKFTRANPKAKIEFGAVRIDGENTFYLRDNGIGFDMKYKDKLFLPFQRLHSLPEFPGTGIGLATVQRIINRHGGKISGESEPEKGATFYLRFGSEDDRGEFKC